MLELLPRQTRPRLHTGDEALKRLAQPDDIANVVAFLASDDARWITGDTSARTAARNSEHGGAGYSLAARALGGRQVVVAELLTQCERYAVGTWLVSSGIDCGLRYLGRPGSETGRTTVLDDRFLILE
jgi:hypothetical protein